MVTFIAPLNKTGYGTAARYLGRALSKIHPVFQYKVISNVDIPSYDVPDHLMLSRANESVNYDDDVIVFWHMFDCAKYISGFRKRKILYTTFEVDGFNSTELEQADQFDEIVTASDWGVNILKHYFPNKLVYKVRHAPYGDKIYNTSDINFIENYYNSYRLPYINDLVRSLKYEEDCSVISSSGKYESRKGQKELLEYLLSTNKQTILIASWHNPFIPGGYNFSDFNILGLSRKNINLPRHYADSVYGTYVNQKNNFTLVLLKKDLDYYKYYNLLHADYYFALSKAEGWNLNLSNMIANTLVPCCATNYSAHTEYSGAFFNIPVDSLCKANDGMFFNGKFNWANITMHNIHLCSVPSFSTPEYRIVNTEYKKKALKIFESITWEKEALKF